MDGSAVPTTGFPDGAGNSDARIEHGETGYREHVCRCSVCQTWQQSSGFADIPADPARHGTTTTYRKGCRCRTCKDAKNASRPKGPRTGPGPNATHGKNSTYAAGCSCEPCKAAHAAYKAQRRAQIADSGQIPHGTTSGYAAKCRCEACRAAHAAAARAARRRARDHATAAGPYVLDLSHLPDPAAPAATADPATGGRHPEARSWRESA